MLSDSDYIDEVMEPKHSFCVEARLSPKELRFFTFRALEEMELETPMLRRCYIG